VVALGVGWWVDRSAVEASREQAATRAAKLESALRTSLGWQKGYEAYYDVAIRRYVGRLPPVQKQRVELTQELLDDPSPAWYRSQMPNLSTPAPNPPSD
jgi:hypothetical protein